MWVSTRTTKAGTASMRARRPVIRRDSQSTNGQSDDLGREVRHLRRPDRPDHAAQASAWQGLARRNEKAQDDRGQYDHEEAHLATQDREVSPSPPRGEEPQHGEEGNEPEAPVGGTQPDQSHAHHQRGGSEQRCRAQGTSWAGYAGGG